ncbi:MAG: hypothetical protein SFT92_01110 [Rickettsiales bacterium]|nr:hypothetical protein [Rickettsiales bacterium]
MKEVHITEPPLSSQSMADLLCTIVVLCQGKRPFGGDFWAYLSIKPSMAKMFKEARERGDAIHLEDYGTIIEWGEGDAVPAHIRGLMEKTYGVNHHYEDDLRHAVEDQGMSCSS